MSIQSTARSLARRFGLEVDRWPARHSLESLLLDLLDRGVDCAVDVGANTGQWSSMVRELGYRGPLISVEPVTEAFEVLERRASRDPRWSVHQFAAGDSEGEARINVAGSTSVSSLLPVNQSTIESFHDPTALRAKTRPKRQQRVSVQPIDSLDVPGQRVLLKTDTQGYDLRVLQGASKTLRRAVAVQCELSFVPLYEGSTNDWRSVVDFMESSGFAVAGMFPISSRDRLGRQIEMDGVFVRDVRGDSGSV